MTVYFSILSSTLQMDLSKWFSVHIDQSDYIEKIDQNSSSIIHYKIKVHDVSYVLKLCTMVMIAQST